MVLFNTCSREDDNGSQEGEVCTGLCCLGLQMDVHLFVVVGNYVVVLIPEFWMSDWFSFLCSASLRMSEHKSTEATFGSLVFCFL